MPTLEQKKEVVSEITELLKDAGAVYVTNYTNMSVDELTALRTKFREVSTTKSLKIPCLSVQWMK